MYYIVVQQRLMQDLVKEVNQKVEEGYSPIGGVRLLENYDASSGSMALSKTPPLYSQSMIWSPVVEQPTSPQQ